ncbi:hypothetical protein PSHT_11743 [Puccinia striiformis]|uniref:CUE domain-containing protein n=1 Tax=Puccinia striiformis TaxID=27350 RepID=A0A2S4V0Z1_9BASI|nr:hypothetical protein PSHT_11743 [Puccinia striiformis]
MEPPKQEEKEDSTQQDRSEGKQSIQEQSGSEEKEEADGVKLDGSQELENNTDTNSKVKEIEVQEPASNQNQDQPVIETLNTSDGTDNQNIGGRGEEQVDQCSAQVQELLAIFPQIQPSILEDVLAAHGNDVSACISDLLAISDPTYKPSAQDSMVQLDEELARQLSLQEQQQSAPSNEQQQQQQNPSNLPYQPRIKRTTPPNRNFVRTQQQDPEPTSSSDQIGFNNGKDEIQKIAEEIGKLAETGKKTMSSWLEKAKAKMQEIQSPIIPSTSSEPEILDDRAYENKTRPSTTSTNHQPLLSLHLLLQPSNFTRDSKRVFLVEIDRRNTRYSNPARQTPSTTPASAPRSTIGSSSESSRGGTEGYTVQSNPSDKSIPALNGKLLPPISSSHLVPVHSHLNQAKIRDDDEESLEYTRNPFEDDD